MDIDINFNKKKKKKNKKRGRNRSRSRSRSNSPVHVHLHQAAQQNVAYQTGSHAPPPMNQGMHPPPRQQPPMQQPPMHHGMQQQQFGQQGFSMPGQPPQPPSQHYGNVGGQMQQSVFSINAAQAIGLNSEQELQMMYNSHYNKRLQGIQALELQSIMNKTPGIQNTFRIHFGPELCKIMLAMLDRSRDGIMQYKEFRELLQCLSFWQRTFQSYDQNRSNFMEAHELGRCILEKYGYKLSQAAMTTVLKRYSRAMDDGRVLISFEDFVALSVRLRAYTEAFRARDRASHQGAETGTTSFGYDDFLQCVLCL